MAAYECIIELKNVKDFDVMHTFDCGQCFRWSIEDDGSYTGIAGGRVANVSYKNETIIIKYPDDYYHMHKIDMKKQHEGKIDKAISFDRKNYEQYVNSERLQPDESLEHLQPDGSSEHLQPDGSSENLKEYTAAEEYTLWYAHEVEFWHRYFDLDRDYGTIKEVLSHDDEVMTTAIEHGFGIRLLQQDPWENVISFIISQNSNIPRIKKCIESISRLYGNFICKWRGKDWYDFPDAAALAALTTEDLAECRLGYRDKYVIAAARKIAADDGRMLAAAENTLKKNVKSAVNTQMISEDDGRMLAAAEGTSGENAALMNSDEAERYIRSFLGVGPKVADCIMLFGLKYYDSFPIDVWMKRIMSELYGFEKNDVASMKSYAKKHFGKYSGFAQQYLFYYARENL